MLLHTFGKHISLTLNSVSDTFSDLLLVSYYACSLYSAAYSLPLISHVFYANNI